MIRIPLPVLGFLVVAFVPGDSSSQEDSINGIPLTPTEPIVALGWRLIDHQAEVTAEAIKKSIASSRRSSGRN